LEVGGKKIRGRKYPWGIVEGIVLFNFDPRFPDFFILYTAFCIKLVIFLLIRFPMEFQYD